MGLNKLPDFGVILDRVIRSGHDRNSRCDCNCSRFNFVSHFVDNIRLWSDEFYSIVGAGLREVGSFGQKSVAGMNSVDVLFFADSDDVRNVEIRGDRGFSFANAVGSVRFRSVSRMFVFGRVDGHSFDVQFRTCSLKRCKNELKRSLSTLVGQNV